MVIACQGHSCIMNTLKAFFKIPSFTIVYLLRVFILFWWGVCTNYSVFHPSHFLHMVECRPTGTFLSIIPSQSAMNLSQDEDLSTTYLFSSFLLAVLQEACLPKFHTMLGFRIDYFRIFLLSQQSQPKLKSKQ